MFNKVNNKLLFSNNVCVIYQNCAVKSQPESKCPELLANYCDMLLRKTPLSKRLTADEIESKLKDVVSMTF